MSIIEAWERVKALASALRVATLEERDKVIESLAKAYEEFLEALAPEERNYAICILSGEENYVIPAKDVPKLLREKKDIVMELVRLWLED